MAGFDLDIPVTISEREIAKIVLRYVQGLALRYELKFSFKWVKGKKNSCSHYYVTIDGQLTSIESWSRFIVKAVPFYVAGLCAGFKRKSALGLVIPAEILKNLEGFQVNLRGLASGFSGFSSQFELNSLEFDTQGLKHFSKPIKELTELFFKYDHGEISPVVLIEQIHTVIELLLKILLKESSCKKDLVSMAGEAKLIGLFAESEYSLIELIRKIRNNAKHQSQGIKEKTANSIIMPSAIIIHKLICSAQENA